MWKAHKGWLIDLTQGSVEQVVTVFYLKFHLKRTVLNIKNEVNF